MGMSLDDQVSSGLVADRVRKRRPIGTGGMGSPDFPGGESPGSDPGFPKLDTGDAIPDMPNPDKSTSSVGGPIPLSTDAPTGGFVPGKRSAPNRPAAIPYGGGVPVGGDAPTGGFIPGGGRPMEGRPRPGRQGGDFDPNNGAATPETGGMETQPKVPGDTQPPTPPAGGDAGSPAAPTWSKGAKAGQAVTLLGFDSSKLDDPNHKNDKYSDAARAFYNGLKQDVGVSRGGFDNMLAYLKANGFANAKAVGDDSIDFGDGNGPIDVVRSDGQLQFLNNRGGTGAGGGAAASGAGGVAPWSETYPGMPGSGGGPTTTIGGTPSTSYDGPASTTSAMPGTSSLVGGGGLHDRTSYNSADTGAGEWGGGGTSASGSIPPHDGSGGAAAGTDLESLLAQMLADQRAKSAGTSAMSDAVHSGILDEIKKASGPVDPNSPELVAQRNSYNADIDRGVASTREAMAARSAVSGTGTGAFDSGIQSSYDKAGSDKAGFAGNLLAQKYKDQLAELQDALHTGAGVLSDEETRALQAQIAETSARLKEMDITQSGRLADRGMDIEDKLGSRDLDIRKYLGDRGYDIERDKVHNQNAQFYDSLSASLGMNAAELEKWLLSMMGG